MLTFRNKLDWRYFQSNGAVYVFNLETLRAGNLSGRAKAEPEKFGPSRATGQEIWKFSGRAEAEPKKFLVGPGRATFFSLKRLFLCNNLLKIIQKLARAEPRAKTFESFWAGPSQSQRLYYCQAAPGFQLNYCQFFFHIFFIRL